VDLPEPVDRRRGVAEINGGPTQEGTYADLGSANAVNGAVYRCTDSPLDFRYNGSVWVPRFPGVGAIEQPPDLAGYTTVNLGSASLTAAGGGWLFSDPAGGSNNMRYAYRTSGYPTSPYAFTIGIIPNLYGADFNFAGIALSDGTKYVTYGPTFDSVTLPGPNQLAVFYWTNATTGAARPAHAYFPMQGPLLFISVVDDLSSNLTFYASNDFNDIARVQIAQLSRTAQLTPSRVGVFLNNNNPGSSSGMRIYHWTGI
jgi:hypothetical protein